MLTNLFTRIHRFYSKNRNGIKTFFIYFIIYFIVAFAITYSLLRWIRTQTEEGFTGEEPKEEDEIGADIVKTYSIFPPVDKAKTRSELLHSIFSTSSSLKDIPAPTIPGKEQEALPPLPEANNLQKTVTAIPDYKTLMGTCQFSTDQCPAGFSSLGQITGSGMKCGDGKEYVTAEAVAEISNGHLSKVYVVKAGSGYNSENPPRAVAYDALGGRPYTNITLRSSVNPATGSISTIDIIDYGTNLENTPKIVVDPPPMASVCNLCCPEGSPKTS